MQRCGWGWCADADFANLINDHALSDRLPGACLGIETQVSVTIVERGQDRALASATVILQTQSGKCGCTDAGSETGISDNETPRETKESTGSREGLVGVEPRKVAA